VSIVKIFVPLVVKFLKRMVDWSDKIKLPMERVDDPPYHSKYNPVEH